jgi:hypothetical protein
VSDQSQESLNARSEYITSQDDGVAEHRINQYLIKQEIGRGSFGAVHLAKDQYGKEYVCYTSGHKTLLTSERPLKNSPSHAFGNEHNLISYEARGEAESRASTRHSIEVLPVAASTMLPPTRLT